MDETQKPVETRPAPSSRKSVTTARRPPPDYFARKEQVRLLILCATLMFVLVMMNEARKPSTWKWMWSGQPASSTDLSEPIDTRLAAPSPILPSDGFVSAAVATPNDRPASEDFVAGITAELLDPIQDNTVMRAAENEAWLTMLQILQSKTQGELDSLAVGPVSFVQLFRQTDFYRGKLVTVQGTVRRAERIASRQNNLGIAQLYRWIVEPGGGSNSPIVVYSLEKPDEFVLGDDLREAAAFTGFCFKRWAYAAGDGTRVAPLILAKTASWQPPPPAEPIRMPTVSIMMLLITGLLIVAAFLAFVAYRASNPKRAEIERVRGYEAKNGPKFSEHEILPSVQDALRSLAESHQHHED